ncbi:unnamed protein product, partial [Closterium sp. NIES-54]
LKGGLKGGNVVGLKGAQVSQEVGYSASSVVAVAVVRGGSVGWLALGGSAGRLERAARLGGLVWWLGRAACKQQQQACWPAVQTAPAGAQAGQGRARAGGAAVLQGQGRGLSGRRRAMRGRLRQGARR